MQGNNPIRHRDYDPEGKLYVQEIFHSIQGEGRSAGIPAVFIRLAGCNLSCWFCDTEFESGMNRPKVDPSQLVAEVDALARPSTELVVITGGEPLRQEIGPLVAALIASGRRVEIETAGTLPPPPGLRLVEERHRYSITISPKTHRVNETTAWMADTWKYIVRAGGTGDDGLPIDSTQIPGETDHPLARPWNIYDDPDVWTTGDLLEMVYVQPMDTGSKESTQENIRHAAAVAMTYGYRLSIQLHKVAELP